MNRKIPEDAFEYYVGLGVGRSYQAVADKYDVTKRAVTECAKRESWIERLKKIDNDSRKRTDEKLSEKLDEMRERHLVTVKAMLSRALAALKQYPLTSGMEAMRAAEMAIKLERLVAGEPGEISVLDIMEKFKRDQEELLVDDDEEDDDGKTLEAGPVP